MEDNKDRIDNEEIIGKDVVPMPVQVYGRSDCPDTAYARELLNELRVSFVEIDIDQDESGRRYVEWVNHGEILTPTIVFGDQDLIIAQPTRNELLQALKRAGYAI